MKAANENLSSYIKLCCVDIKFKLTNQGCQSTNVEWRICGRNGQQFLI